MKLNDFCAYLPLHRYLFLPTGQLWPAKSVNAECGNVEIELHGRRGTMPASRWLDQHRALDRLPDGCRLRNCCIRRTDGSLFVPDNGGPGGGQ
jgi:hypothetical protein